MNNKTDLVVNPAAGMRGSNGSQGDRRPNVHQGSIARVPADYSAAAIIRQDLVTKIEAHDRSNGRGTLADDRRLAIGPEHLGQDPEVTLRKNRRGE